MTAAEPSAGLALVRGPEFWREGLAYVFEPRREGERLGVRLLVERLKPGDDTLWGLLTVTSTNPGLPREVLGPIRHNFMASRGSLIGELTRSYDPDAARGNPDSWNEDRWRQVIQRLGRELLAASRSRASVDVIGLQDLTQQAPDLVEKLIEEGQPSLLFGPGGAGKGWLSIALALCCRYGLEFCGLKVRQAEPVYLDAEADFETFLRRVKAVGRGLGLERAELVRVGLVGAGPLGSNLEQISRVIAEYRSRLVIHDSVGKLSVEIGQHGNYEDAAKQYADAISLLGPGLSHWLIDHVSGEGLNKALAGKPINSIRKIYDSRVAWEIKKEQEAEAESLVIGLYHAKWNNTRKFTPVALRLEFQSDPYGRAIVVRFRRASLEDAPAARPVSAGDRAVALLRRGKLSTEAVALALEVTRQRAREILDAEVEKGRVIELEVGKAGRGNSSQWGVREGVREKGDISLPPGERYIPPFTLPPTSLTPREIKGEKRVTDLESPFSGPRAAWQTGDTRDEDDDDGPLSDEPF